MPKKPISIEQINAMSKEEVQALNAKLGRQVVIQFGTKMLVKWVIIIAAIRLTERALDMKGPAKMETNDAGD